MASVANCDIALIIEGLKGDGVRLDGRGPLDYRDLEFEFAPDSSSCLLRLGRTRILSTVNAELGAPRQGRENQGTITFKVGLDANVAQQTSLVGGVKDQTVMLTRWLEKLFFIGNALDREALCVVSGQTVWNLSVDVRVLDNDGNLGDACVLSVLGALSVHRRADVTSESPLEESDGRLHTHQLQEREPLLLTLHHLPIPVTVAVFETGSLWCVDPDAKETAAMTGGVSIVTDPQGSILNVQKIYGSPLPPSVIVEYTKIVSQKALQISKVLQEALKKHEIQREKLRVFRSDDETFIEEKTKLNCFRTNVTKRQDIQL